MRRMLVGTLVLALGAWFVPMANAQDAEPSVQLEATISSTQEVPTPTGTLPGAGGTASFEFDETQKSLTYTVTLHDLTSNPLVGHIHTGNPGVAGGILVALPSIPTANGTTTGTVTLPTDAAVENLYDGGLYINFHTALNPSGEVRGQIVISKVQGKTCSCKTASSPKAFKMCVKKAIHALDKSQRKSDAVKKIRKLAKKSTCGKTKGPKKAIACCLPQSPVGNILIGHVCAAVPEGACANLGGFAGKVGGASCFPNPCVPPASPSGAFVR